MVEINVFRHARDAESVPAGHVLFREGDVGNTMFAVAEGEVELTVGGEVVEESGRAGSSASSRSWTTPAECQRDRQDAARIVEVDADRFGYLVHEHPTFALQVMTVMAERLRRANVSHH